MPQVDIARATIGSFVTPLIMFYVRSQVVHWTVANTVLYEGRPVALYVLNTGYSLVSLLIGGALLAVWA